MKKIYNKILIASDGSDDALRAAGRVIELQEKYGCDVIIFHSVEHHMVPRFVPLGVFGQYSVPSVDYDAIRRQFEERGKAVLKKTKDMFTGANGKVEARLIKDEDPEDYIIRIAEEENFDLVALGCKGEHSKLKRVFMGTVATKVLNEAPCDVLVVR